MVERSLSMWELPGAMPGFSTILLSYFLSIFLDDLLTFVLEVCY